MEISSVLSGGNNAVERSAAPDGLVSIAEAWCRQIALVEPGMFERLLAGDCVAHGLAVGGGDLSGPAEVLDIFQRLSALYPRKDCRLLDAVVEGEKIAFRWTMTFERGLGDWRTDAGEIEGMTILVVRNGRVAELWTNFGRWWV